MDGSGESGGTEWVWGEEKAFENALAQHFTDGKDESLMIGKVAAAVPGKSLDDVLKHYWLLVEDIKLIDSGQVALPEYVDEDSPEQSTGKKASGQVQERRKGVAWSEEEHRQFLAGLHKFGKGDWRSIARHFVMTRTPTQVASHAQKYFNRLKASNKDRRRSSIHDITIVDNADTPDPQRAITGPTVAAMLPSTIIAPSVGTMLRNGMTGMQPSPQPVLPQGVNLYSMAPHANLLAGRMMNMHYPMQAAVHVMPMKFPPKNDQTLHPASNR